MGVIYNLASTMEEEIAEIQQLYDRIPQQLMAELTTALEEYALPAQELQLQSTFDEDTLNSVSIHLFSWLVICWRGRTCHGFNFWWRVSCWEENWSRTFCVMNWLENRLFISSISSHFPILLLTISRKKTIGSPLLLSSPVLTQMSQ